MKKFLIKLVIRMCIAVAFTLGFILCSEKWISLFCLYMGLFGFMAVLNLVLKFKLYCQICEGLELVGDSIPRRANHLHIGNNIKEYLRFAPRKEIKKFIDCRANMQEEDLFFGEVNLVVETVLKRKLL